VKHFQIAEAVNVKETIPSLATEIILSIDGKDVPINNVGFGISQLIPVVFSILNSDDEQLCIVDEPEIHLHPSLQSKLADFFMHMALIGKRIAIETHSEYLIDKLIFLKLKHNIDDDKINLIWVKKDEKGAYIEDLKYDDLGYIINPPDGFLSEKKKLVEELSKIRLTKL
jgi:predicted ATPase